MCHHWDRLRQTFLIISKVISKFALTPGMHTPSSEMHSTTCHSRWGWSFVSMGWLGIFSMMPFSELYHQLADNEVWTMVCTFQSKTKVGEHLNVTSFMVRKPWKPLLLLTWPISTWSAICLMFAQHLVSKELSEKVEKKINISAHLDSLSPFSYFHTVLGRNAGDLCIVGTWRMHSVNSSKRSMD